MLFWGHMSMQHKHGYREMTDTAKTSFSSILLLEEWRVTSPTWCKSKSAAQQANEVSNAVLWECIVIS